MQEAGPIRIDGVVDGGLSHVCEFSWQEDGGSGFRPGVLPAREGAKRLEDCLGEWWRSTRLPSEYRLLIAEMSTLFKSLHAWSLCEEQSVGGDPASESASLRRRAEELGPPVARAIDNVWEGFQDIAGQISKQDNPVYRDYLRVHLLPYLMTSPFAWRSYAKPLGYAGDYQCVNMIEGEPDAQAKELIREGLIGLGGFDKKRI